MTDEISEIETEISRLTARRDLLVAEASAKRSPDLLQALSGTWWTLRNVSDHSEVRFSGAWLEWPSDPDLLPCVVQQALDAADTSRVFLGNFGGSPADLHLFGHEVAISTTTSGDLLRVARDLGLSIDFRRQVEDSFFNRRCLEAELSKLMGAIDAVISVLGPDRVLFPPDPDRDLAWRRGFVAAASTLASLPSGQLAASGEISSLVPILLDSIGIRTALDLDMAGLDPEETEAALPLRELLRAREGT